MIYGIWQSAAGLQAQGVRQDVLANNLANSETPGFKPDGVSFRERLIAARADENVPGDGPRLPHAILDAQTGGLTFAPRHTDFSQSALVTTANPLDLAIQGDGFFAIRTPQGKAYTRSGQFTLREDGTLVMAAGGLEVLDRASRPIRLDRASREPIRVDSTGAIRQGSTTIGGLDLTRFADPQALRKTGRNLFDAGSATPAAFDGEVKQFAYEGSGVDTVSTLVKLIEATRAYEFNATMITLQDGTLGRAVNDVGRLG